ncbi:MAG: hypothetical protein COA43_15305 [Robiginitomaculum sp.]|nr:MAG: hypothetical protein COA43_15305 [Robiginitomaculum sp.]
MSIVAQNTARTDSWSNLQLDEDEVRERERKKIKLTNILFWPVIIACIYVSTFYIGAFFDAGKMIGVGYADRADRSKNRIAQAEITHKHSIIPPLAHVFTPTKMFFKAGQTIQLNYALPDETSIVARIKQCDSVPLFEVFKCKFVNIKEQRASNAGRGTLTFTVESNGFYYFEHEVSLLSGTVLEHYYEYQASWQRS